MSNFYRHYTQQERDNLLVWAARCVRDGEPFPTDLHVRLMEVGLSPTLVEIALVEMEDALNDLNDIKDDEGTYVVDVLLRREEDEDDAVAFV